MKSITTIDRTDQREMHIAAFSAVKQGSDLKIGVIGCVKLLPTRTTSKNVIGIIELDDQVVPILDSRKEKTADITNSCCIVILENLIGDTTIMTGRLYESSSRVFDLVVECTDSTQGNAIGSEKDTVSPSTLLQ